MSLIQLIFTITLCLAGWSIFATYFISTYKSKYIPWTDTTNLQRLQGKFLVFTTLFGWWIESVNTKEIVFLTVPFIVFAYSILNPVKLRTASKNAAIIFLFAFFFILFSLNVIIASKNLLVYFLAIELISFSLIILMGSNGLVTATEAAIKLFFVSAISSGLFLLGMAGFYFQHGTVDLSPIHLDKNDYQTNYFFILLFTALFIKLPVFPFHAWYADIYGAAKLHVIPLFAVSTIAYFYSFVTIGKCWAGTTYNFKGDGLYNYIIEPITYSSVFYIGLVAGLIHVGLVAVKQEKAIFRFFGYSSVINITLILYIVMISEFNDFSIKLALAQLIVYSISIFVLCLTVTDLFDGEQHPIVGVETFRNLINVNPIVAGFVAFFLISAGGLPITGGFITTNWVLAETFNTFMLTLDPLFALITIYITKMFPTMFSLRIIAVMSRKADEIEKKSFDRKHFGTLSYGTIAVIAIGLIVNLTFIFYPDLIYALIINFCR